MKARDLLYHLELCRALLYKRLLHDNTGGPFRIRRPLSLPEHGPRSFFESDRNSRQDRPEILADPLNITMQIARIVLGCSVLPWPGSNAKNVEETGGASDESAEERTAMR